MTSRSSQSGAGLVASLLAGAAGALIMVFIITHHTPWLRQSSTNTGRLSRQNGTATEVSGTLAEREATVIDTVKRTTPAVVSIVITKDVPVIERFFQDTPSSPFDQFFGGLGNPFQFRVPQLRQRGTERREVGGGSGFLVSADGLIVTNRHVVVDTDADYTVFTNDGSKHEATVVARDPANDIAIIKISGNDFPHLTFGDSDQLQVGQTAIAIGNALSEFQNTVSVGVISGLSRSIVAGSGLGQAEQLDQVLQTDAAINPGNSGGPLLNLSGEVIGVNVAVALGSENIGFALPANSVKSVVESVQTTGKIVRPFLGVRYAQITPVLQEQNNLTVDYGVLIVRGETAQEPAIVTGSPADKAGLKENDIILEVDGTRLTADVSLASIIAKKRVGDTLRLKILTQGTEKDVTVTLQEIPTE